MAESFTSIGSVVVSRLITMLKSSSARAAYMEQKGVS